MYKLKISEVRKKKRISQRKFAKLLKITPSNLCEIEKGKYEIKLSLLLKAAKILEVCPCDLFESDTCKNCKMKDQGK